MEDNDGNFRKRIKLSGYSNVKGKDSEIKLLYFF